MVASGYAIIISGGKPLRKRIDIYSRGAATDQMMLMIWIFILAGAFAHSAKVMGAIDATVNLSLTLLPGNMLLAGLFLAACFISLSVGTSVGTIVALTPIAAGVAEQTEMSIAMMTAVVVGGSLFGDNLSFISDTTIVATSTQGCKLSDKFRVNSFIVIPAAFVVLMAYIFLGAGIQTPTHIPDVSYIKVIPYLAVLITACAGMNVTAVLTLGIILTGIIGIVIGSYDLFGWFNAMGEGIKGMGELIIITMMAGGLLEVIKDNGGIDFIINRLTRHVSTKRGAELAVAGLVSFVNFCTANNTVAILTVGGIAKQIGDRFGVDNRKCASILDTFSCTIQGIIPYGAQLLMAAGLAQLNPVSILPYLYYPLIIGIAALLSIIFRYPKRYS
jgi:Na+/H+ antiporter NhaC